MIAFGMADWLLIALPSVLVVVLLGLWVAAALKVIDRSDDDEGWRWR